MASTTTTSSLASPTSTDSAASGGGGGGGGPTNSPLLFFVALGFGVVFTNLWIIVGVKYCFRYNQRNRAARALNENGEPIDLNQMTHPRRRRREKKLMSMEEVNDRFPLTKYKIWRSSREAQGLPTEGGVTAPPSRAASVKDISDEEQTIDSGLPRPSAESARPQTTLDIAQQDHANANAVNDVSHTPAPPAPPASASSEKVPEIIIQQTEEVAPPLERNLSVISEMEDDDDDPIRTAAPPEMLAAPGDTCAICLDTLDDDDDVRGLTCGHAFHGSCVDPWLTSRRACCPLCKADYYVPKPRADGDDPSTMTGRRNRGTHPQHPPIAWIGGRGVAIRPRMIFAPRFYPTDNGVHEIYNSPAQPSQPTDEFYQDPAAQRQTRSRSWRSRLPTMSRFGRRASQPQPGEHPIAHVLVEAMASGDLEAQRPSTSRRSTLRRSMSLRSVHA